MCFRFGRQPGRNVRGGYASGSLGMLGHLLLGGSPAAGAAGGADDPRHHVGVRGSQDIRHRAPGSGVTQRLATSP